jgi:hypothetical protein
MKTFLILAACAFCGFVVANRRNSLIYELQNRSANTLVSQSEGDAVITSTKSKNQRSKSRSRASSFTGKLHKAE